MLEILRHLVAPDATKYQDRRVHTQLTQEDTLLQNRHANIVCQRTQVPGHLCQTVSVGVGLNDDHTFGGCHMGADGLQVPAQLQ